MAKMNLTPLSVLVEETWGPIGTPERDKMENKLEADLNAYFVGEAIKRARLAQKLTQEQLGERVGVQKSQISKLEKGRSIITLPTINRIFKALGFNSGTLKLGDNTEIALW